MNNINKILYIFCNREKLKIMKLSSYNMCDYVDWKRHARSLITTVCILRSRGQATGGIVA